MLLSRVLGVVGRVCIGLGVLTLLFVAYQLWGTGLITAQAQDGLDNEFDSLVEEAENLDAALIAQAPEAAPTPDTGDVDDDDAVEPEVEVETDEERAAREEAERNAAAEIELLSNLLWQDPGEPVSKLRMPTINVDWTVVAGVGTDELAKGPGHYPGTTLPGMPGNAGIAGHRTTWGAPFNRIDELEPGDEIFVETLQGDFTYRVMEQDSGKGHFIVSPERVDVLDQDFEEAPNRITLTACHPKFSARQRIIVVGELVGEPAAFIPPPDLLHLVTPGLASEEVAGETDPGDADLPAEEPAPSEDTSNTGEPDAADDTEAAPDTGDPASDDGATAIPVNLSQGDPPSLQGFAATDDFGEGLNGDSSAVIPAVMWGLAAAAIAIAAGYIARRWKKLPTYALSLAPFAVVLFVCFVHIDQALPSY